MFNFENESEKNEILQPIDTDKADAPVEGEAEDCALPSLESPQESAADLKASKPARKFAAELLDYLEIFVLAIGFVIILFSFVFRICTVEGDSMKNTLYEDESLVVTNLFYEPKPEDIIVFHQTGTLNEPVVKRVIAVEGETVAIRYTQDTMTVTVTDPQGNQRILTEEYMLYEGVPLYLANYTATVPEGCIFVLGDNRNNSMDSRNPGIGMVDTRRVLGKVVFRISPFSRMGVVS